MPRKLRLIGYDAADWKAINPLLDAGEIPNLATLYPALSPKLWTSIATGKRARKHGVFGFSEPDPNTDRVRPISNLSSKTKAVWKILNQPRLRSNVVVWWPSHPVEPINGAMVSDRYNRAVAPLGKPWPMRPGMVCPPAHLRTVGGAAHSSA